MDILPYRDWREATEEPVQRLLTALRDCEAEEFGGVDVAELEERYLTVQNWLARNLVGVPQLLNVYASGFHIGDRFHERAVSARKAQDVLMMGLPRRNPPSVLQDLVDLHRRLLRERPNARAFAAVSMLGLLLSQRSVAGMWPPQEDSTIDQVQRICEMPV